MADDEQPTSRWSRIDPLVFIVAAVVLIGAFVGAVLVAADGASSSDRTPTAAHHMYPQHVTPQARAGELKVYVGDYWFKPSAHRLHAGVYRLVAHNYGAVQHDVMMERTPIEMTGPGEPIDEAAPYGVDGLMPGMTMHTTMTLTAGRWELFCSVPGHFRSGQHQMVTVYGKLPPGAHAPRSMGTDDDGMGMGMGMGHMQ